LFKILDPFSLFSTRIFAAKVLDWKPLDLE